MLAMKNHHASLLIRILPRHTPLGSLLLLLLISSTLIQTASGDSCSSRSNSMTDHARSRTELRRQTERLVRYETHVKFLSTCVEKKVIPKGMILKFGTEALPKSEYLLKSVRTSLHTASWDILHSLLRCYKEIVKKEQNILHNMMFHCHQTHSFEEFEDLHSYQRGLTIHLARKYWKSKRNKLQKLIDPHPPCSERPKTKEKRKCRRFKRRKTLLTEDTPATHSDFVINLSSTPLTEDQLHVLALGPQFTPTPHSINQAQLEQDVREGCRLVRLRELHFDAECPDPTPPPKFYKKNFFTPKKGRDQALDQYCDALVNLTESYTNMTRPRDNLQKRHRIALGQLRQMVLDRTIRVSPADKGGTVVVQDVEDYIQEAMRQLDNPLHYTKVDKDPTVQIARASNDMIQGLHANNHINDTTRDWALTEPHKARTHQFYHLPKVHKSTEHPPGRPIISGCNGPTEKLSKLADSWLQDIVTRLPSYIKDSTHVLRLLEEWNMTHGPFGPDTLIVTIDVVGLYTNIPHSDMMLALRHFLDSTHLANAPPTETIVQVVRHVVENNFFTFEGNVYHQVHGTAMGTPVAPSIANLFMGWLEGKMLHDSPVPVETKFWRRFIDDIMLLWTGTATELDNFKQHINSYHPTIKFTIQASPLELPFLDIKLKLQDGFLCSDLYTKPTDRKAYLPYSSCHPRHCKDNIPFSQFLRVRRLCSLQEDFTLRCNEIAEAFTRRGYKPSVLTSAMEKVQTIPRCETLNYRTKKENTRVPFVITHNPANPPLRKWLNEQHKSLHRSKTMQLALPDVPVVGERNSKNLRSIIMPSVLPPVVNQSENPGIKKCSKKCVTCREHLVETHKFSSSVTRESFSIRHNFTCTSDNIIYLLFCCRCDRSQYVGETRNTLKVRLALHRTHIRQDKGTYVTKHFNLPDHTLQDMRCHPIEKLYTNDPEHRKHRELFWRNKLKTNHPYGLNDRL